LPQRRACTPLMAAESQPIVPAPDRLVSTPPPMETKLQPIESQPIVPAPDRLVSTPPPMETKLQPIVPATPRLAAPAGTARQALALAKNDVAPLLSDSTDSWMPVPPVSAKPAATSRRVRALAERSTDSPTLDLYGLDRGASVTEAEDTSSSQMILPPVAVKPAATSRAAAALAEQSTESPYASMDRGASVTNSEDVVSNSHQMMWPPRGWTSVETGDTSEQSADTRSPSPVVSRRTSATSIAQEGAAFPTLLTSKTRPMFAASTAAAKKRRDSRSGKRNAGRGSSTPPLPRVLTSRESKRRGSCDALAAALAQAANDRN